MIHLLFVFLFLARLVYGSSANLTSSDCPSPDSAIYRSVWSILGSCALTLIICVWHAIHPKVPCRGEEISETLWKRMKSVLHSFLIPEGVVMVAVGEWCTAHDNVRQFRERGYKWSMTHSYFAGMRGFVYRNDQGELDTIGALRFLDLCEAGKIANPLITVKEIKGLGKSDGVGKAIFALQLFWFMLQVAVRGSKGLAITLVEIDTVCMAVLTLLLLVFWWDKPLRPECPHIFYSPQEVKPDPQRDSALRTAWRPETSCLYKSIACLHIHKPQVMTGDEENTQVKTHDKPAHSRGRGLVATIEAVDNDILENIALFTTWVVLGALHLIAWNFDFPTETEKIIWRVAALVLAGAPLGFAVMLVLNFENFTLGNTLLFCAFMTGVASRVLLVVLMLISLRALPCSAHEIVSWTAYIPHL